MQLAGAVNNAISIPVRPGNVDVELQLQVLKTIDAPATLSLQNLVAQTAPADVVRTSFALDRDALPPADAAGRRTAPVTVDVTFADAGAHTLVIRGVGLRPATTYKTALLLQAGTATAQWDVTIVTGPAGVLAASRPSIFKFSTIPFAPLFGDDMIGTMPITLPSMARRQSAGTSPPKGHRSR